MIKLISMSFSGIGRFVDKQFIDFSSKEKLLQIDGRNDNTGGSSGSGKTTVFHALDYLLGMNEIPATTLQSRLTKSPISVEGDFEIDGKKVKISRSKKDGLSISIDGEITSGNVKAAEELLDTLIGIPKKIFKKMIHKKQKEGGFFLNLTAKESYDFLTKALGLETLTSKVTTIDQDIKKNKENLIGLEKTVTLLESGIESGKKDLESFTLPEKSSSLHLEELQFKLEKADSEIYQLNLDLTNKTTEFETRKPTRQSADITKLNSEIWELGEAYKKLELDSSKEFLPIESNINTLKHSIKQSEATIGSMPFLRNDIAKLVSDMKSYMEQKSHIEKSQCPTCMQAWAGDSAKAKINTIQQSIDTLKTKIIGVKTTLDKEPEVISTLDNQNNLLLEQESTLKRMVSDYTAKKNAITVSISEIKNKAQNIQKEVDNDYNQKLNAFDTEKISTLHDLSSKISSVKEIRYSIKSSLDSEKSKSDLYEKSLQMRSTLDSRVKEQTVHLNKAKKDSEDVSKTVAIAEESKRLIKSYSLQKFQETLESIGETASDILRNVPNMATASIYFEGSKETGSGTIKEEVTAFINMDGEPDIDIKSLSGGERTTADLAVDLAVIDVLEAKAGKGADFFILDEPFDGIDPVTRIAIIDIIKGMDSGKRIIVVDHGSETKEIISDKITAVRTGETSYVV